MEKRYYTKDKNNVLRVRLSESTLTRLGAMAKDLDTNVSELVRALVDGMLALNDLKNITPDRVATMMAQEGAENENRETTSL